MLNIIYEIYDLQLFPENVNFFVSVVFCLFLFSFLTSLVILLGSGSMELLICHPRSETAPGTVFLTTMLSCVLPLWDYCMALIIFYCDLKFILDIIPWKFPQPDLSFLPGALNQTLLFINSSKGALLRHCCGSHQSLLSAPFPAPCCEGLHSGVSCQVYLPNP